MFDIKPHKVMFSYAVPPLQSPSCYFIQDLNDTPLLGFDRLSFFIGSSGLGPLLLALWVIS